MAHWPFQIILRFILKSGDIITIALTISSGFIELVLSPGPSVKPELSSFQNENLSIQLVM